MHHLEACKCHFNFNGDFSGNVEIEGADGRQCSVPFEAIKILVGEYLRREFIARVEEIPGGELVDRFGLK